MREASDIRFGGCQCGAVRYRLTCAAVALFACHCTECRKQSASAFGISYIVPRTALQVLQGQPVLWSRPTDAGNTLDCAFCPTCGSRLWHQRRGEGETVSIKGGSLDDAVDLGQATHIWTCRKLPGVVLPPGTLSFPREPDAGACGIQPITFDAAAETLLRACGLAVDDLTGPNDVSLFGCAPVGQLEGMVGLEVRGPCALLRSLAVAGPSRSTGLGAALVAFAEHQARTLGVAEVYLLTTTADRFFARLGYVHAMRADAPAAIASSRQFSGLCPMSSAFMVKRLDAGAVPPATAVPGDEP